jgi:hypothetical protein
MPAPDGLIDMRAISAGLRPLSSDTVCAGNPTSAPFDSSIMINSFLASYFADVALVDHPRLD